MFISFWVQGKVLKPLQLLINDLEADWLGLMISH